MSFPFSNYCAEIGVKTIKQLITDKSGPKGELDTDAVQRVILQCRNTPDPDKTLSPAMCVFGWPIRNFILIPPGKYGPHDTWRETLTVREEALRKCHIRGADAWAEHTKHLLLLKVGDFVHVQNQTGHHPKKWYKTGSIVEVRQHDQYVVKIDGSGRVSLRNQRFLHKFHPVCNDQPPPRSIYNDLVRALVATLHLSDLVSGPVTPVVESGPTPPPAPLPRALTSLHFGLLHRA